MSGQTREDCIAKFGMVPNSAHLDPYPKGSVRYALGLLAEEAGEIAQVVGKAFRFGLKAKRKDDQDISDLLHEEVGDILAAADYAVMTGLLDRNRLELRRAAKLARLLDPDSRTHTGARLAPPPASA